MIGIAICDVVCKEENIVFNPKGDAFNRFFTGIKSEEEIQRFFNIALTQLLG